MISLLKRNSFINNIYIYYGVFIASNSKKICFIKTKKNKYGYGNNVIEIEVYRKVNNIISGFSYSKCIAKIYGVDYYNQIMLRTNENLLKNLKYKEIEMDGEPKNISEIKYQDKFVDLINNKYGLYIHKEGYICIQSISRNLLPLKKKYMLIIEKNKFSNLTLEFSLRPCIIGESLTSKFTCEECLKNTFSFKRIINDFPHTCLNCFGENFFCHGGNRLSPKPGYWRLSNKSFQFFKCPKKSLCKGSDSNEYNESSAVGVCQKGSTGVFCTQCFDGYGVSSQYTCLKCSSRNYIIFLTLKFIGKFFVVLYFIFIALKMSVSIIKDPIDYDYVFANNLIKIFNSYQEILVIIFSLPINISFNINSLKDVFSNVSLNFDRSLISLDCIPTVNVFRNVDNYYLEFFLLLAMPKLFIILYLIFIKLARTKLISKNQENFLKFFKFKQLIFSFLIIIYWFSYISIIKLCFQMLASINVGDENLKDYRLVSKYSIKFSSASHRKMIVAGAIPVMAVFGIGYPLIIYLFIKKTKNEDTMENSTKMFLFGFIYFTYQKNYYYWDFLIMFRKILIILVDIIYLVKVQNGELYPISFIIIILFTSLLLQLHFNPYTSKFSILFRNDNLSLMSLMFILFICQIYISQKLTKKEFPLNFNLFLMLLGFLILSAFLIKWSILYFNFSIKSKSKILFDKFIKWKSKFNFFRFKSKRKIQTSIFEQSSLKSKQNFSLNRVKTKKKVKNYLNNSNNLLRISLENIKTDNLDEIKIKFKVLLLILKERNHKLELEKEKNKKLNDEIIQMKKIINNKEIDLDKSNIIDIKESNNPIIPKLPLSHLNPNLLYFEKDIQSNCVNFKGSYTKSKNYKLYYTRNLVKFEDSRLNYFYFDYVLEGNKKFSIQTIHTNDKSFIFNFFI